MRRIIKFFKESYEELKKVVWPSRAVVVRHTVVVVLSVAMATFIVMAIDYGLQKLVEILIKFAK